MGLISQNAHTGRQRKKGTDEEGDLEESHQVHGEEEAVGAEVSGSTKLKRKKRKRKDGAPTEAEKDADLESAEEKRLEGLLFGSLYSLPDFGKEGNGDGGEVIDASAASQFYIDKTGGDGAVVHEEDLQAQVREYEQLDELRDSVWFDDEEEKVRVDVTNVNRLRKLRQKADESVISGSDFVSRLRAQHVRLNPGTEWARIGSRSREYHSSDDESGEGSGVTAPHDAEDKGVSILQSTDELLVKDGSRLLPGILEYSRLIDANIEESSNGPISSVQFHRNAQLLLAAGLDRRLRFFNIFIEDCPIRKASFLPEGSQVIISGRRRFFYCFDLVKAKFDKVGPLLVSPDSGTIAFIGNEGYILLVSSKTKNLIGTLKMNGTVRSLAFSDDGRELVSSGGDGHIYHWDLGTRKCFHKGVDEGCLTGSALCTSQDSTLFAAGSSSGIVNVYSREEFLAGKRKPVKAIENLTTKVDCLRFNCDAQMLAICSSMKKNSLKLLHVPSFTYPRCLDFSPNGGFMAVGNAAGKVLLYKLHHYQKA
ncbi:unnamed protein product [Spirodela intermedia]|uniref:Uncharacterized protein n=1 Tax=Spirodela intermedia TaxID=51605 RepID=A0A7I8JHD7_SPIIN|nr:unnamed protein product [Spirodela intermedia]CAA6668963.1 unnamed protein product [Spirodela intermedia]